MENCILNLYNKYIDDIYSMSKENLEISKKVVELENNLLPTLSKEQKELLDKINNLENDRTDLLTNKELKEVLNFGKNKVYKLLQNGEIPSTKIGRDYRILKINVINYLQNQK